jgi:hypothetical protein
MNELILRGSFTAAKNLLLESSRNCHPERSEAKSRDLAVAFASCFLTQLSATATDM